MRVTEQIDALTTLSTNPFKYLVVPRVVAATLALPVLVAIGDVIGVLGGYLVGIGRLGFDPGAYIKNTLDFLEPGDVDLRPRQGGGLRLHPRADGLLPRLQFRARRPRRRPGDDQRRRLRLDPDPRGQLRADGSLLLMAPTPKIELEDVWKSFGDNRVLAGVSLSVDPGRSLVIIGGSGTGKSVTLKCILGIETADRGEIRIDGTPLDAHRPPRLPAPFRHALPGRRALRQPAGLAQRRLPPAPRPHPAQPPRRARPRHRQAAPRRPRPRDRRPLPRRALRRHAEARRPRPRHRHRPGGDLLRRTDRRPRPDHGRRDQRPDPRNRRPRWARPPSPSPTT